MDISDSEQLPFAESFKKKMAKPYKKFTPLRLSVKPLKLSKDEQWSTLQGFIEEDQIDWEEEITRRPATTGIFSALWLG